MRTYLSTYLNLVFSISSGWVLLTSPLAAAPPSAGYSIAVQGKVEAEDKSQTAQRLLKRGSAFFSTDTVTVGADGKAQLKFIDGGLVTLLPNTIYRISSYVFTEEKSEVAIELIEGGFRAMTGTIGKTHPTNYTIKTPTATIAVRGTIFDVLFRDGELNVGSIDGTVLVTNSAGVVSLSPGNYVTAASSSNIGASTSTPPPTMTTTDFAPPPGGESLAAAQAAINQQSVIPPPAPAATEQTSTTDNASSSTEETSTASSSATETSPTEENEADWLYIPETVGNPSCG